MEKKQLRGTIAIIFINAGFILGLMALQFVMFAYLPSSNPSISVNEQQKESLHFALSKDLILLLEAVAGLGILYLINRKAFGFSKRTSLLITLFGLILLVIFAAVLSLDYIDKVPFV